MQDDCMREVMRSMMVYSCVTGPPGTYLAQVGCTNNKTRYEQVDETEKGDNERRDPGWSGCMSLLVDSGERIYWAFSLPAFLAEGL